MNRRILAAVGALLLATAAVVAATYVSSEPEQRAVTSSATTPSTTAPAPTSTTTTTLPVDPLGDQETETATARNELVDVFEQLPASARPARLVGRMDDVESIPFTRTNRAEIPSLEQAVIGRRRVEGGWQFDNPTPFGNPLTFVVVKRQGGYAQVMMPVRPNGTVGWIAESDLEFSRTNVRVQIDLSERVLSAFAGNDPIAMTKVVVGASDSPTPLGRFYLTDFDEKYNGSAYGPWVLPLNSYSEAMDMFSNGVPVIALHGTNRPELVGLDRSNGCIRLPNDVIVTLRETLPLGTIVDVVQ